MKHDANWFALMVTAILLLLSATRNAEYLFAAAAIGLCGTALAYHQRRPEIMVLISGVGTGLATIVGLVLFFTHKS